MRCRPFELRAAASAGSRTQLSGRPAGALRCRIVFLGSPQRTPQFPFGRPRGKNRMHCRSLLFGSPFLRSVHNSSLKTNMRQSRFNYFFRSFFGPTARRRFGGRGPTHGATEEGGGAKKFLQPSSHAATPSQPPWCAHSRGGVTLEHLGCCYAYSRSDTRGCLSLALALVQQ